MSECEIITILQELFNGVKRSSLVNLTLSEEHQVETWLDNKLSEAWVEQAKAEARQNLSEEDLEKCYKALEAWVRNTMTTVGWGK